MYDSFKRQINYLRISVTDRCNLRCVYCMPPSGVQLVDHADILSFEEILDVVRHAQAMGIDKIRITGGEPLVRKGVTGLISDISKISGIKDLSLTTNGILLEEFAKPLYEAGLKRVNISLDSLDPEKFRIITRGGDISRVLKGIDAAINAGLSPVKINCVVNESSQEEDALTLAAFCKENGLEVRYIKRMDLEHGVFSVVEGGSGGDCLHCNRLRLTANGYVKPCLFNDIGYSVRKLGPNKALNLAIKNKPECGTISAINKFNIIGG